MGWRDNIKDFSYGIRANLATLKNEVTYLDPSLDRLTGETYHTYAISYFEEGYPVYYSGDINLPRRPRNRRPHVCRLEQ